MLGINLCSVYPANNAYIYVHYCTNLKLPDIYVGIVGCIYRIKIDPFLFPYFFEQWSGLGACAPPFNLMIFHNHCWCICSYPISLKMQLSSLLDVG